MPPTPKITLGHWRTAIAGAASEIATYALSFPAATVHDAVGLEQADAMIGAHIPLVGGGQAFDLGVVSSPEGCKALSRAILGAAPTAVLRDAEVADAVGEIANMLGGSMKRRLAGLGADLVLGLPIFVNGQLQPTDRMLVIAHPVRFGPIDTIVMIAGHRD